MSSPSLRKPENLPPAELAVGVNRIVSEKLGATVDEIVVALARLLGFESTSAQLRSVIIGVVNAMASAGKIRRADGQISMS